MHAVKCVSSPRVFLMLKNTSVFMYLLNKIHKSILDLWKKAERVDGLLEQNQTPENYQRNILIMKMIENQNTGSNRRNSNILFVWKKSLF